MLKKLFFFPFLIGLLGWFLFAPTKKQETHIFNITVDPSIFWEICKDVTSRK